MVEKNKKIVFITGAEGMLGRELAAIFAKHYKVIAPARKECDITDAKKVTALFLRYSPWLAIHAAGFTDVDGCEENVRKAYAVNAQGTCIVSKAARTSGTVLIYVSTDYVFSGAKHAAYRETDRVHPLSVYGRTKLEGEEFVRKLLKKHIIIRTSWLFGTGRDNFITNVMAWAKEKECFSIVCDKYACPTYTIDLAKALYLIAKRIDTHKPGDTFYGTYHIANSGYCSWFDYANYILKVAKVKNVRLLPVAMAQMKFKAKRPAFSVLDSTKFNRVFGYKLRPWQKAVKEYMQCTYH